MVAGANTLRRLARETGWAWFCTPSFRNRRCSWLSTAFSLIPRAAIPRVSLPVATHRRIRTSHEVSVVEAPPREPRRGACAEAACAVPPPAVVCRHTSLAQQCRRPRLPGRPPAHRVRGVNESRCCIAVSMITGAPAVDGCVWCSRRAPPIPSLVHPRGWPGEVNGRTTPTHQFAVGGPDLSSRCVTSAPGPARPQD